MFGGLRQKDRDLLKIVKKNFLFKVTRNAERQVRPGHGDQNVIRDQIFQNFDTVVPIFFNIRNWRFSIGIDTVWIQRMGDALFGSEKK